MGRKSLQIERRAQILDACEAIVLEEGLAGASPSRIAGRVGIDRTTVHHYFRTQADLLAGLVERIVDGYLAHDRRLEDGLKPDADIAELVDFLLSPGFELPHYDRLMDEVVAAAHHHDELWTHIHRLHRAMENSLISMFSKALPDASPDRVREFVYTLHPLIEGVQLLQPQNFPADRLQAVKRSALKLVEDLIKKP